MKLDSLPISLHTAVEESDPHQVGDSNETGVFQAQKRRFPLPSNMKQCWY